MTKKMNAELKKSIKNDQMHIMNDSVDCGFVRKYDIFQIVLI